MVAHFDWTHSRRCAGVDKGAGLRRLAEILNIDIADTIAVGDNINDLPMIKAAGLGIGVRNVNPLIRDECDVVLNSSNDEDPLTEVIERMKNSSNCLRSMN